MDENFYDDFTTTSDFEEFAAKLEECFYDWRVGEAYLNRYDYDLQEIDGGNWSELSEDIDFCGSRLRLSFHFIESSKRESDSSELGKYDAGKDIMHRNADFPSKAHCLYRWFGLRRFFILSSDLDLLNTSQTKLYLSALCVALRNSKCTVPAFAQIGHKYRKLFTGLCVGEKCMSHFDMTFLRNAPPQCDNLSGLLQRFKNHSEYHHLRSGELNVSIRFTYVFNNWQKLLWTYNNSDLSFMLDRDWNNYRKLPFGACVEPVPDLLLACAWSNAFEQSFVENDSFSDLEPETSNEWRLSARTAGRCRCLATDFLQGMVAIASTAYNLFNHSQDPTSSQAVHALSRLTDSSNYISNVSDSVTTAAFDWLNRKRSRWAADHSFVLSDAMMEEMMAFIFDEEASGDEPEASSSEQTECKFYSRIKSSPLGGITQRMAVSCCVVYVSMHGIDGLQQLWKAIVDRLRWFWDNDTLIPSLENTIPNLGYSLLYQKLQLLNRCIEKKSRNMAEPKSGGGEAVDVEDEEMKSEDVASADESTNDEFFDCEDNDGWDFEMEEDPELMEPRGRKELFGHLLNGEEMYIPITQETMPLTEDQLAEQADVLTRLGTSAAAAEVRARMQSASLLSDMEAFKAANPTGDLKDFVRWYSPRDFNAKEGSLSQRMLIEGNIWLESWESAKCRAITRQKRLFDETLEAEKILHFLEWLPSHELARLLLPCLFTNALKRLNDESVSYAKYSVSIDNVAEQVIRATRNPVFSGDMYQECLGYYSFSETTISEFNSLLSKFSYYATICDVAVSDTEMHSFIIALLDKHEIVVERKSPLGRIIKSIYFSENQYLKPVGKEYIIRAESGGGMPQRMFATCTKDDFRLAIVTSTNHSIRPINLF